MTSKQQSGLMVILVVLYCVFIDQFVGFGDFAAELKQIDVATFLALMLLLVATQWLRTLRLKSAISEHLKNHEASFIVCYRVTQIHNVINTMLPFRAGEFSMPLLLRKGFNLPFSAGVGFLFWFRLLDVLALCALCAWIYLTLSHLWGLLVMLIFVMIFVPKFLQVFSKIFRFPPRPVAVFIGNELWAKLMVGASVGLITQYRLWLFSVVNWGVKITTLGIFVQLMSDASLISSMGSALGGELSSILPIHAPAGIGTYAAGVAAAGKVIGLDFDLALRSGVLLHIVVVVSGLMSLLLSQLMYLLSSNKR